MKEQKVLVTGDDYASTVQSKVNEILEEGWLIVSVTAQHIATGSSMNARGGYFILFERTVLK
jgi:hypothetical protein